MIDLSIGATGSPTSAAIVSSPTHGMINVISGTKVTYTPGACFSGTDTFTFTLANASGNSNVATATITVTTATTGTISTTVYLIDPFLLTDNLQNVDLTPLEKSHDRASKQATGLVADNTSAAIAIMQTNDCTHDVTFTTTNGTTLLPYNPNVLTVTKTPTAGKSSLVVSAKQLSNINGLLYTAALVQAPIGTVPSFTAPIVVTAQQGTKTVQAQMAMVPPPVLLVHGIWSDQTALAKMGDFLKASEPWQSYPNLVWLSLCYSKYLAFNAPNDPLPPTDDPCEQTSKDAIGNAISSLTGAKGVLDRLQIVGSRVDVVAHSMGGLAIRNYASQASYKSSRNRQQGDFNTIITLDTPDVSAGAKIPHWKRPNGSVAPE
jgi:hypothetical protein